jgi:phosphoesterase family protein
LRRLTGIVACAAAVTIAALAPVRAAHAQASTTTSNLIVDGSADAGYCTTDWTAATTVPGWTVNASSPDIICSSAGSFSWPGTAPGAFFAPGDQGDGNMTQTINVSAAASAINAGGVTYNLSGWLGGWGSYPGYTQVTATFYNGSGDAAGTAASLPTVSAANRDNSNAFLARSASGTVPAGTTAIVVGVAFADSSDEAGYAANLALTLTGPGVNLPAPRLTPPASAVPAFQHVFMIMMENTDYSQIMEDPSDTPFMHSLMSQGTLLANMHGVYHPSDENYMAVAGGDTYAVGAEYYPDIKDPSPNLGDELTAAGKTWKAYEQGMGTPCNLSSNDDSYYEPDDAPFINYTDVSGNPAYCAQHLFDTAQLATDLRSAPTTPSFSWIAADDYYDGESSGNGDATSLRVQDGWLRQTITPIMRSPAWTTQKSLLVLTWDESDYQQPDNHIAAILLGSRGTVSTGYVSSARHDSYSLGATIEHALGIAPFTSNDKYGQPVNEAFTGRGGDVPSTLSVTSRSGSSVTLSYSTQDSLENPGNWIGIYPAGDIPDQVASTQWRYTPGPGGTVTFSNLAAGTYDAYYLYDNAYITMAGPVSFTAG